MDVDGGDLALGHGDAELVEAGDDVADGAAAFDRGALVMIGDDAMVLEQGDAERGREVGAGLDAERRVDRVEAVGRAVGEGDARDPVALDLDPLQRRFDDAQSGVPQQRGVGVPRA